MKQRLNTMAALFAATLLLSGVAIYNGYPLVWPDTSGYIGLVNLSFRSFFYNLLISPTQLARSLWPVVFFQSLIVAHLLWLVLRMVFATISVLAFLGIVALLSLLSGLPWLTGFIMPDIFTPVLVLSLFLLVFCLPRLSTGERRYLFGTTTVATMVHFSHIFLAVGLLLAACIFSLAGRKYSRLPILYLSRPFLALLLASGLLIANSYLGHGVVAISPSGYAFPLARLVADGPAVRYLREHCPERHYALCNYIDELPQTSDEFLWSAKSPFRKVGSIDGYRREGQEIVVKTISHYPIITLKTSLRNTVRQIFTFRTGHGLISYLGNKYPTFGIKSYFPNEFHAYENSKQSRNKLGLGRINRLHKGFIDLSLLLASVAFLIFLKRKQWLPTVLLITIAYAYVLNALITGSLSGPNPRYAERLIWLVPFFSLASVFNIFRRGEEPQREETV